MATSTPVRCFKSGLDRRTRAGARFLPSSSARAHSPRRTPMVMCVDLLLLDYTVADCPHSPVQVVLDESVSYDDFVVPPCPRCDAEGRRDSMVGFVTISSSRKTNGHVAISITTKIVWNLDKARFCLLWRVHPPRSQGSQVRNSTGSFFSSFKRKTILLPKLTNGRQL